MRFSVVNATKFVKNLYGQRNVGGGKLPVKTESSVVVGLTDSLIGYNTELKQYIFDRELGVFAIPVSEAVSNANEFVSASSVTLPKGII